MYTYMIYSFWSPAIGLWHLGDIKPVSWSGKFPFLFSEIDTLQENPIICKNFSFSVDKKLIGLGPRALPILWPSFMALNPVYFKWQAIKVGDLSEKRHPRKCNDDVILLLDFLGHGDVIRPGGMPGRTCHEILKYDVIIPCILSWLWQCFCLNRHWTHFLAKILDKMMDYFFSQKFGTNPNQTVE